jgi:beta-lactamase superfamily II metal-dependent hydrolase
MTPPHTVRIAFLDVGQGDSIVVSIPETKEAVIIDCPEADTVFDYLLSEGIRHIRGLLITHLHMDHFKETAEFLENCSTKLGIGCERLVIDWFRNGKKTPPPDADEHSDPDNNKRQRHTTYHELRTWADIHEDNCVNLEKGPVPLTGPFSHIIEILQPSHGQKPKLQDMGLNNSSAILRIAGSGTSALLTADIEPVGWHELLNRHDNLHSDILKFPHHGAWKNSNPTDIIDAVQPSIVVISVGSDGTRYDHPNQHVFQSLACHPHIRLLCTQVTTQCVHNLSDTKQQVIEELKKGADSRQASLIRTSRGCPCSGTVIVELGSEVQVIQPEKTFHRTEIIERYFHNHQCRWNG